MRERTAELEAFSYTIAHDLRAPLRAIHRFSDVLLEDYTPRLDEQGREYLRRMAEGAARMDRLIEDLLAYSRISRADIQHVAVDVGPLLSEILSDLRREFGERRVDLTVEGVLPPVLGDRVLLKQALSNLMSNAVKFVVPGAAPVVRVDAAALGGVVRITVRDNGIGIDPKYHDRIFRIFERLSGGEDYPGTGVGLAIVKKAVARMNGRVGLDSEPGKGSSFWIELAGAETP